MSASWPPRCGTLSASPNPPLADAPRRPPPLPSFRHRAAYASKLALGGEQNVQAGNRPAQSLHMSGKRCSALSCPSGATLLLSHHSRPQAPTIPWEFFCAHVHSAERCSPAVHALAAANVGDPSEREDDDALRLCCRGSGTGKSVVPGARDGFASLMHTNHLGLHHPKAFCMRSRGSWPSD